MHGSWRTDAWRCAMIGSASSSNHCCRALAYSWLQAGSHANPENCLLRIHADPGRERSGAGRRGGWRRGTEMDYDTVFARKARSESADVGYPPGHQYDADAATPKYYSSHIFRSPRSEKE